MGLQSDSTRPRPRFCDGREKCSAIWRASDKKENKMVAG